MTSASESARLAFVEAFHAAKDKNDYASQFADVASHELSAKIGPPVRGRPLSERTEAYWLARKATFLAAFAVAEVELGRTVKAVFAAAEGAVSP